ncbi:hypothetical protein ACMAZE_03675 [Pseudopelagicola sp. nBUS_20]|uniref:hypothetical protein n=1 Tax=Pseudopelagicola sp. nBUS_20 TaxID=3395317 RepID=UPI003EB95D0D
MPKIDFVIPALLRICSRPFLDIVTASVRDIRRLFPKIYTLQWNFGVKEVLAASLENNGFFIGRMVILSSKGSEMLTHSRGAMKLMIVASLDLFKCGIWKALGLA